MNSQPAGAEDLSDEDEFDIDSGAISTSTSSRPRTETSNSHSSSRAPEKHSFMPAGAESDGSEEEEYFTYQPVPNRETTRVRNAGQEQRFGKPVARMNEAGGRGRGILQGGKGGFGTPTPSASVGRGKKRNQFSNNKEMLSSRSSASAAVRNSGPSPIVLEDFKVAVIKGNCEAVQKFIGEGIGTNTILNSGWTALMHAANASQLDVVHILIKNEANVNFQKDMYTVLMAACGAGPAVDEEETVKCVDLLLEHGARTGVYDRHHMTPLIYAAREGRVAVCIKLLEKGAQIDKQDARGWTALSWAASEGHGRLVRVLLDHKADPKIYSLDGQAPSDIAYSSGHSKISGILEAAVSGNLGVRTQPDVSSVSIDEEADARFGELELFLFGLELGHLVPKFKEHKIAFESLVKMTETDLDQIGVTQIGVRKKLLDAIRDVHTKEWNTSSLQQQNKDLLSAPEVTNVLANISKHLSVVHSSVGYVQKQLQAVSDSTQFVQDVSEAEGLTLYANEALQTAESLRQDLASLQSRVTKLSSETALTSADLITTPNVTKEKSERTTSRTVPLLVIGIAGVALGFIYYKKYKT